MLTIFLLPERYWFTHSERTADGSTRKNRALLAHPILAEGR
jgi:hypothetical protein